MKNKKLEEIARFTQNEAKHLNRNSITSLIEQFIIEVEKLETLNNHIIEMELELKLNKRGAV